MSLDEIAHDLLCPAVAEGKVVRLAANAIGMTLHFDINVPVFRLDPSGELVAAMALWFLLGPAANRIEVQHNAPIVVDNLPRGYALESVEPSEVSVTLSGPRGRFVLADLHNIEVRFDAFFVKFGRRIFHVEVSQVRAPPGIEVVAVEPGKVRLSVRAVGSGGE